MSHAEWVQGVEQACGWVEMATGSSVGLRAYARVLSSRPVSLLGRTVGYGVWKLAGGT